MGMVRKTFSIATLGAVSFRSKKEKLRRADRSRQEAELALEHEHHAREAAETRVAAAEKRVKHATAEAQRNAQRLEKAKKAKRRKRRRAVVTDMLRDAEPVVRSGADAVRSAGSDAAERGRKAGRKAGRRAQKAGKKAAARAAKVTKDVVVPGVEKAATKLGESIDELSSR